MSSLTPCNYCSLQRIRSHAKSEGAEVKLRPAHVATGDPEWFGWWAAVRSDKTEPVAYYMEVTAHCVC